MTFPPIRPNNECKNCVPCKTPNGHPLMSTPTLIEIVYLVCIAHVWSRGSIFKPIRKSGPGFQYIGLPSLDRLWIMLADCPLCSGFWIGVIGHFIYWRAAIGVLIVTFLGIGSLVGSMALALCAIIRRI